ncbi:MAG: hypothetical protein FK731_06180 [Asgard group archaeon]|nr:hypothetical protein [Asgard group archaeon]
MSESLIYDLIKPIFLLQEVDRQLVYYLISGIIGAAGIIGVGSVYFLIRKKWSDYQDNLSEEERYKVRFKEKLKVKLNLALFVILLIVIVFVVTALPFIVSPNDLRDIWTKIGLFGLLGLGTPATVIVFIIIYRQELMEIRSIYSAEEPLNKWYNFGLVILGITLPLVCLTLITLYRKHISNWKKILFVVLMLGVLAMWLTLAIWSSSA